MKFSWTEWLPFRSWRLVGVTADADEVPDRLPPKGVVVVGSPDRPKWIAFDCPCGTGHRIMLNADHHRRPTWRLAVKGRRVTLYPSVDFLGDRKRCHYFIRNGRVEWV
jgi:hypothetical protein